MADTPTTPTPETPAEPDVLTQIKTLAEQFPTIIPPQFNGDPGKFVEHYKSLTTFATQRSQKAAELEKKITEITPTPPVVEETSGDEDTTLDRLQVTPKDETVESEDHSVNWEEVMIEFGNNQGAISDATRQKIIKAGIPEQLLEATLAGQKALWMQQVKEAEDAVGGRENLQGILNHVRDNFTPQEITAFNKAMENPSVYKRVLRGLLHELADAQEASTQKTTKEPTPTPGTVPVGSTSVTGFATMQEMLDAMNDPRYNRDPSYTKEVHARTAKSLNK